MNRQQTTVNALQVAATVYRADAKLMREQAQESLALQFEKQAREAEELANEIENG